MKRNKGITLIALVITIIVLLILAGITINMLLDDNGIIGRTRNSTQNFINSVDEENRAIEELYNEMSNLYPNEEEILLLQSEAKVGDYVSYSANGQTTWRILYKTDSEIIILAVNPTVRVNLIGNNHYTNCETVLDQATQVYLNSRYANSVRSLEYSINHTAFFKNDNTKSKGETSSRVIDDITPAINNKLISSEHPIWLASTYFDNTEGDGAGYVRNISVQNGNVSSIDSIRLTYYDPSGMTESGGNAYIMPVVTLKPSIRTTGQVNGVWQLISP